MIPREMENGRSPLLSIPPFGQLPDAPSLGMNPDGSHLRHGDKQSTWICKLCGLTRGRSAPSAVGGPMGASQGPTFEYAAGNLLEAARLSDPPFIRSRPETLRATNYND